MGGRAKVGAVLEDDWASSTSLPKRDKGTRYTPARESPLPIRRGWELTIAR